MLWNIVFLPIKTVLAVVVSVVLVRGLLRDGFDAYAIATSLLATIGLYSDLGIERALPRFVPEVERTYGRDGLRTFVFNLTAIKLGILAAISVGLWFFADSIIAGQKLGTNDQGHVLLAMIAALLILGAIYDICTQFLYSFFKQKITNLLDITVAVVKPVLTVLFVYLGWGVVGVMFALLLTTILSVGIALQQAWKASREAQATGTRRAWANFSGANEHRRHPVMATPFRTTHKAQPPKRTHRLRTAWRWLMHTKPEAYRSNRQKRA